MSGGGAQSKQPNIDHTFNIIYIGLGIGVILIWTWYYQREIILAPVVWLRHCEFILIEWVMKGWSYMANLFHLPVPDLKALYSAHNYLKTTPISEVRFELFASANKTIGHWMQVPCILFMALLCVFLKFYHTDSRFKNTYNMQKLKKEDSQHWPEIMPILNLDLLKEDLDKGPWAMAQLPMDFCREHDLLWVGEKENKKIWKVKSNQAHSILALQLGPTWTGIHNLPIEIKALVVIFIARALREREVANQLLSQIAMSSASGKLNFAGVEKYVVKYADAKPLKWLEKRHAYVYTLLASLLEIARTDGVLASAEFLWLKPVNRRLWYMLNSVGRMTAVVEISGAYAHWLAEKELGRGVKTPMVKEALTALESTIEDSLFIEEGDRWRTDQEA